VRGLLALLLSDLGVASTVSEEIVSVDRVPRVVSRISAANRSV